MKKLLILVLGSLPVLFLHAQEPADALRFSWYTPGGTARVQAIGGAMGSLGGDITATFVNPAGLAFYKTGDLVFSPAYRFQNTKGSYYGYDTSRKASKFNWGTTGVVFGGSGGNSRSSAISFAYNRTADFNSKIYYGGKGIKTSYSQKFVEEVNRNNIKDGNVLANDFPFGASLAFNTFWIDTLGTNPNGSLQFQSRAAKVAAATGLLQSNSVETRGGIDEFALGFGVNKNDKLMLGGSIGVPVLHMRRESSFIEEDPGSTANKFDFANVVEELTTKGVGFNLKLGAIYKPQEYWRLGLALHSPTWYTLNDVYETYITANIDSNVTLTDYSRDYNNGAESEFKYNYYSPYKLIGSISYVIREIQDVTKQRGFITADVEYVNYKASSFSAYEDEDTFADETTKSYLRSLNKAIDNAYKGAFNFRLGGELKFTTVMVRLGASYYGNPYKNIAGEKGHKLNLSGGLGYRNKGVFVDLTYVHAMNRDVHFAYRLSEAPYEGARLKNRAGTVALTLGFKI